MTTLKAPPSPPSSTGSGHSADFDRDPLDFLTRCARDYGDVVRLQFDQPVYLLSRADLVEEVVQSKQGIFLKELRSASLRGGHNPQALKYEAFREILGQNVLTADGEDWRRRRRILAPPFQYQPTLSYVPTIVSQTRQMLSRWEDGESLEIREQMMELTLGVVSTALMGVDISGHARDEGLAFRAALDHFYHPSADAQPLQEALDRLHHAAVGIIAERREGARTGDVLSLLLHAEEDGGQLTDDDMRNELLTFLFAGHETTANGLSWTLGLLALNPDKQAHLFEEVRDALGDRPPTAEDLPRLAYTQMVVQESLRLYPPVWFLGRFLQGDWEADGYPITSGSGVIVSQWVVQRDHRYFAEPDEFTPERWADGFERRLPRGAYFPFGDGPRVCIGRPLALMEMGLVVAEIMQAFEVALAPGQELIPEPMNTIRPKDGLTLQLRRR